MSFGQNIVQSRMKLGLSQKDLAEMLMVSAARLSQWENDKREPAVENIKMLSNVLHVSSDYLLDNEPSSSVSLSPEEHDLIDQYRNLDSYGKHTLHVVLQSELARVAEQRSQNESSDQ